MLGCSYSALREKEVINLCDGRRLGFICDLELCDGQVTAIVVPGEGTFFGFGRCARIVIPWEKIVTIGSDAILVRADAELCTASCGEKQKGHRPNWFG